MKLYEQLAVLTKAIENCKKYNNIEWLERHEEKLARLIKENLPSGSGYDNGTTLELITDNRMIFKTSFHHMSEHGFYTQWSEHKVMVSASFIGGIDVRVGGKDVNGIKHYIATDFYNVLTREVE
jgi:hypothetical protein